MVSRIDSEDKFLSFVNNLAFMDMAVAAIILSAGSPLI